MMLDLALYLTGGGGADAPTYPISPVPLRLLIQQADWIGIARAEETLDVDGSGNDEEGNWRACDSSTRLHPIRSLKGEKLTQPFEVGTRRSLI
jgi:hypothetical protein